jgi:hypothetical protein
MLFLPGSVSAIPCPVIAFLGYLAQAGDSFIRLHDDIASIPAITPVRAAKRDKLLPAEADGTISAITCFHLYLHPVDHPRLAHHTKIKKQLLL